MIEMGKIYKTRDGHDVRILCTDARGEWPVIALVVREEDDVTCEYYPNGRRLKDKETGYDIIVESGTPQ